MESSSAATNGCSSHKINEEEQNEERNPELEVKKCQKSSAEKENDVVLKILEQVKNCPVVFQSQQIGDPELSSSDKIKIAEDLLQNKPVTFLMKFGEYLSDEQLNYFLNKFSSYEVEHHVKNFKNMLNDHSKKIIQKNRRYEAMKRLEAEGKYFSETEMEKRQPLLYHQLVGQFLSEKERLIKNREAQGDLIPTFSNYLIQQMEREEMDELIKSQQKEEDRLEDVEVSDEEETNCEPEQKQWGEDWEEKKSRIKIKKKQMKRMPAVISKKEKQLLLQEFQSIMKNNFLNGKDSDFDYSTVDLNSEYDSIDIRGQDEEDKYFDEETSDATVCTDTGVLDY